MFKYDDYGVREDVEVHFHAFKIMTEEFSCVNGATVLENCIVVRK
jgi:hypothetical protein